MKEVIKGTVISVNEESKSGYISAADKYYRFCFKDIVDNHVLKKNATVIFVVTQDPDGRLRALEVERVKPTKAPTATSEPLEGEVKWYNPKKGFGFIIAKDGSEHYFNKRELDKNTFPDEGCPVRFSLIHNKRGQTEATNLKFSLDRRMTTANKRPYYGKPTYREEIVTPGQAGSSKAGGAMGGGVGLGAIGAAVGGPLGLIIGGAIGSALGYHSYEDSDPVPPKTRKVEITCPCIKCGHDGQVTAEVDGLWGFQCPQCGHSWRLGRNICIVCRKKGLVTSRTDTETSWECPGCQHTWSN